MVFLAAHNEKPSTMRRGCRDASESPHCVCSECKGDLTSVGVEVGTWLQVRVAAEEDEFVGRVDLLLHMQILRRAFGWESDPGDAEFALA